MESKLRIVLLGKTGVGKSASGNTILGKNCFKEDLSAGSVTVTCQEETREFEGKTLIVTDTPGLFHTKRDQKQVLDDILDTILKIEPGPNVLLLVLKLGSFLKEDISVLEAFEKVFEKAKPYTIVLFTHGEICEAERFIKKNKSLDKFISDHCAAYHAINNEAKDDAQVTSLLQKICQVVQKNSGGYYSNKMFKAAEEVVKMWMQEPGMDSKEKAIAEIMKCLAQVENKLDPGILKGVQTFLKFVQEVTLMCMPKDCS